MSNAKCVCLSFFLCLPVLAWTQQNPVAPAATHSETASVSALSPPSAPENSKGRIKLDVVVTDRSGKPLSGLALNDFTLLDNDQPSPILSFHAFDDATQKPHPPVEIILVLDTVNETHQQVAFARQEIARFLRQNDGRLPQPVSLFVLTDEGLDAQRLPSTDGNALATKVDQIDDKLRTIGSATGSWGAVERFQLSIKTLMDIADSETRKPGRKLLIWAGSGWPLMDSPRIQTSYQGQLQSFDVIVKLSTKLHEARISAYSISAGSSGVGSFVYKNFLNGVKTAQKALPTSLGLRVLAVQSGGSVQGPDNDLTAQINRCFEDARAFYTLSFDSPAAGHANEYHDLKVLVDKPGLTARTSTGYYNQP
jgi:VWFA-related protein